MSSNVPWASGGYISASGRLPLFGERLCQCDCGLVLGFHKRARLAGMAQAFKPGPANITIVIRSDAPSP